MLWSAVIWLLQLSKPITMHGLELIAYWTVERLCDPNNIDNTWQLIYLRLGPLEL